MSASWYPKEKVRKKKIGLEKNNCRKSEEKIQKESQTINTKNRRKNAGGFDSLDSSNN